MNNTTYVIEALLKGNMRIDLYLIMKQMQGNEIIFRVKAQPEQHIGDPFTGLNNVNIDMISIFVHVVLLGFVRKLMMFWNKVPFKVSSSQKSIINERVKSFAQFLSH